MILRRDSRWSRDDYRAGLSPRLRLAGEAQFGLGILTALVTVVQGNLQAALIFALLTVAFYFVLGQDMARTRSRWWGGVIVLTGIWVIALIGTATGGGS